MDYGKFKYENAQKAKESRKKATNVVVKEMKYRPKIGRGDFDTKTRKVHEFLGEGHKVKVTIMFRGREVQHPELGRRILDRVAETVVDVGRVEALPKVDGRNMTMVLGPDKQAQAKKAREDAEAAEALQAEAQRLRRGRGGRPGPRGRRAPPRPTAQPRTQPRTRRVRQRPPRPSEGAAPPPRGRDAMPKMKTHRGAKKRFKVTGSGKVTRRQIHKNHFKRRKPADRQRRLAGEVEVTGGDRQHVLRQLGKR